MSGCANGLSASTVTCFDSVFSLADKRRKNGDKDADDTADANKESDSEIQVGEDVDFYDADEPYSHGIFRCCCRRASPKRLLARKNLGKDKYTPTYEPNGTELPPLGAGGCIDQDLSQELREIKRQALRIYEKKYPGKQLSYFQSGWLTAETLHHFANPAVPEKLAKVLHVRGEREDALTKRDVWLNGSLRIVGHDREGTSILSWESITMRKSFSHYIDHAELLIHLALDMNRPGNHGWIHITDYHGWNPLLFMNPVPMARFASWVEGQFRRRLKLAIFVDMPAGAGRMLNFMLRMLKPATRSKVRICSFEESLTLFRERCDEDTARDIERYLRNRREGADEKQYWHPIIDIPWFREELAQFCLDGEEKTTLAPEELQIFREAIHAWHRNTGPGLLLSPRALCKE